MAADPPKGSRRISGSGLLAGAAALATVITAVVGTLNQLGYIGNHETSRVAEVSAPAPPAELPAIKPGGSSSLTGAWRDAVGGCHLIIQTGSKLAVTNYFRESDAVISHGDGTVDGTQIQLRLQTMHGDFQISPDGRILHGVMYRSFGPGPSTWQYIGSSCPKAG
jgi:hypothetical protein